MKKILFVTYRMGVGGVEKSIANWLNVIDKQEYELSVMVLKDGGEFLKHIPDGIKVVKYDCPDYIRKITDYAERLNKNDLPGLKRYAWNILLFLNKVTVKVFKKAFIFDIFNWRYKKRNPLEEYDMVVDFHGYGSYTTFLVAQSKADCVKVSWIHEENIYAPYKYIGKVYKKFDKIFGVCKQCVSNFNDVFPMCSGRTDVLYNYLDISEIKKKALENVDCYNTDLFKIVSVGRVSEQKAFRKAVETAKILKCKGKEFIWKIVGSGEELEELKNLAINYSVDDVIVFEGYRENPYVYMQQADLYVQTSRAEGFCTTVSEAIVLGKPVVATMFGGIEEQLDDGQGGIITDHSPASLANAIEAMMEDKEHYNACAAHCENKNMDFENEINKLLELLR